MAVVIGFGALMVATLIGAMFLSIGASVAGIEGRSFGKALGATVGAALAGVVVALPLSLLGLGDGFIAAAIGLAVNLGAIRTVYGTSWGKSLVAWFVETLAMVLFVVVPVVMLGGAALLLG